MTDQEKIEILEMENRLLKNIALSAIAMKVCIESGLPITTLSALDRDLAAYKKPLYTSDASLSQPRNKRMRNGTMHKRRGMNDR